MRVINSEDGKVFVSLDDVLSMIVLATPYAHGHPLMGVDEVIEVEMDKLHRGIKDAAAASASG